MDQQIAMHLKVAESVAVVAASLCANKRQAIGVFIVVMGIACGIRITPAEPGPASEPQAFRPTISAEVRQPPISTTKWLTNTPAAYSGKPEAQANNEVQKPASQPPVEICEICGKPKRKQTLGSGPHQRWPGPLTTF